MNAVRSIRAARVDLALALMEASDRYGEARSTLRAALDEPGQDPPEWRIHLHLANLADRAGRGRVETFSALLAAAIASRSDAEEPARRALAMLDAQTARGWVPRLDSAQVRALVAGARLDHAASSLVSLAARVSFLRGDAETAGSLISASSDENLRQDPVIGTAQAVTRALGLVDDGEFGDALALLSERECSDGEPASAWTQALALCGAGGLDEALATAVAAPATFEAAMAQALVWLRRAAVATVPGQVTDAITQAGKAASTAARLRPSSGDGLLLRAQVELEGGLDVAGGHRLLEKAVRRLKWQPERARLWRLQQRLRDDDVFRYMKLEVAAVCERQDELLAVTLADLPFRGASVGQNAAVAELVATALRGAERGHEAADFFEAAVDFHSLSGEPDRAVEAERLGTTLRPTAEGLISVADNQWQVAHRVTGQGREAVDSAVAKGLAALDQLAASDLEQGPYDRVTAAYLRGLLLARRASLGTGTVFDCWTALPWLLAAALQDPKDSYRSAHLAWVLRDASIARPALDFAEQALRIDGDDAWVQECAIVMQMNWHGVLDERTRHLAGVLGYDTWSATMRAIDALHRDDLAELGADIDDALFDALWARENRAQGVARLRGFDAAEPLFRSILEEATREPVDLLAAADAALQLRNVDDARRYVRQGASERMIYPRTVRFRNALIDLVDGRDGAVEALRGEIGGTVNRFELRDWAYSGFPVLALAWAAKTDVVEGLRTLRHEAEARLRELPPLPPLTIEIDEAAVTSTDRALDSLVRQLLQAHAQGGVADPEVAGRLRRLAREPSLPAGFGAVLDAATTAVH